MSTKINTVGVIGTGVIGASWTGLFLAKGLHVLVSDPGAGAEDKLKSYLQGIWPTLENIGLASNASISNFRFVGGSLSGHYQNLDFIQENAPERLDLKTKLIGEIDAETRPDVIIASSSSGIVSSQFTGKCKHPGRVLIGHPFNPPHLMPLVELVPNPSTSKEHIETAISFYKSLGKRPVLVKKEIPGFAANRLQAAVCSEAYSLVQRGVLSAEDVDACVTTSLGPRWALNGPYMSNVFGGGGGKDGFKHILGHLGPAMEGWLKDMDAHSYHFTEENLEILDDSVQEMLEHIDVAEVERERDDHLVKLLKDKAEAPLLV